MRSGSRSSSCLPNNNNPESSGARRFESNSTPSALSLDNQINRNSAPNLPSSTPTIGQPSLVNLTQINLIRSPSAPNNSLLNRSLNLDNVPGTSSRSPNVPSNPLTNSTGNRRIPLNLSRSRFDNSLRNLGCANQVVGVPRLQGGMDVPDGRSPRCCSWFKSLIFTLAIVIMIPTALFVNEYWWETQAQFEKVKTDLCSIKDQMNQMHTNKQHLETIGTDTKQKLDQMEKLIGEVKGNKGDSADSGCCGGSPDSSGGNDALTELVKSVLVEYDADKTGKPDFALESSGGSIIGTVDTEPFEPGTSFLGIPICCAQTGPRNIIQPSAHPGDCWAFKGSSGSVKIKLLDYVFLSGVTLEHISKGISPSGEIDSAPREFSIWGFTKPDDTEGSFLGRFYYDRNGLPWQYFKLEGCTQVSYQYVQLNVHSNFGNPRFTCVYRLRVHGTLDAAETSKT